jgi:hypothetical protein
VRWRFRGQLEPEPLQRLHQRAERRAALGEAGPTHLRQPLGRGQERLDRLPVGGVRHHLAHRERHPLDEPAHGVGPRFLALAVREERIPEAVGELGDQQHSVQQPAEALLEREEREPGVGGEQEVLGLGAEELLSQGRHLGPIDRAPVGASSLATSDRIRSYSGS